jgi:hypothetical protein
MHMRGSMGMARVKHAPGLLHEPAEASKLPKQSRPATCSAAAGLREPIMFSFQT